jgi:hypothetical protein
LEGHSMWILAPAFLAIAFTASPAAPAEYIRSGSVIYITGEIGSYDYVDHGGGASRSGSASVTTMHALFTTEVECKTASAQSILVIVRFSNDRLLKSWPELQIRLTQLARESLRRQAWPTSGEVVTGFQSDTSRTDSPVRVPHAQPASPSPTRHI